MPKKPLVTLARGDLIIISLLVLVIGGLLGYSKMVQADEVQLTPVEEPAKVAPVNQEQPSALDKLKAWLREQVGGSEPEPDVQVKMDGQQLSTETVEELESIFSEKSADNTERIMTDAKFDAKQIDCLVRNQVFEASGEPKLGQLWVYHVVRNRTLMEYRGNETMCETIFDPKQFSWANTNPDRVPKFKKDVDTALAMVNELYYTPDLEDITCGATHYLKKDIMWDVDWSREALLGKSSEDLELIAIIGKHAFFGNPEC